MDRKQAAGRKAAGSANDADSAGPSFSHHRAPGYGLFAELFCLLQFPFLVAHYDEAHFNVGMLGALPYAALFFAMLANGWHSDQQRERRWHCAVPSFIAAVGLLGLVAQPRSTPISLLLITLATLGNAYLPALWAMPTEYLSKSAAAAAVGMINGVGSVAGFAGPYLFGYLNTKFGSFSYGLSILAFSSLAAGLLVFRLPKRNLTAAG